MSTMSGPSATPASTKAHVIIGAGKLGITIAKRLFLPGWNILLVDRSKRHLATALKFLEGFNITTYCFDIGIGADTDDMARFASSMGHLGVIVNTVRVKAGTPFDIYYSELVGSANLIESFHIFAAKDTTLIFVASMLFDNDGYVLSPDDSTRLAEAPHTRIITSCSAIDVIADDPSKAHNISQQAIGHRISLAASNYAYSEARINFISRSPIKILGVAQGAGQTNIGGLDGIVNAVAFLIRAGHHTGMDVTGVWQR